jgi:hypothetical protein
LILSHIMMYCFEHAQFCVPLILFNSSIDARNEQLSELFPPLDDELYSTYIVIVLFGTVILAAFTLPPIQYGLAHKYFMIGSGLLKSKL